MPKTQFSKTQIGTTLKNSNCDLTFFLQFQYEQTKNLHCDKTKKNSLHRNSQPNFRESKKNSNSDKTQKLKLWEAEKLKL